MIDFKDVHPEKVSSLTEVVAEGRVMLVSLVHPLKAEDFSVKEETSV